MRWVSWTSDSDQTIVFSGDEAGPFYYKTIASDLGATAETSRTPRQDGVTTWYTALDARTINLEGAMWVVGDKHNRALAQYDRARAALCQAMSPNRWGTLTYYREDGPVQVRCRPMATPTISSPVGTYSTIDVTFTTDSPYWESAEEMICAVGIIQRFFRFTWSPVRGPLGAFGRYGYIDNPTSEIIYPTVEVYATGQEITLTNRTTGEFITIEHAIADGQKLVVDLKDVTAVLWTMDEEGAYRETEDVSHWMSLDSEPWGLRPGRSSVVITNEAPEDTPIAYIRWRVPYLGV